MDLSIIVPIYNVANYISRCIQSVINQDFSSYELILVNDGSTDKSGEICDELALKYENITIIHKKNGGLSSARNAGLDRANGDYIMFLDSDDWIEQDCLSQFHRFFDQKPDLIMGRAWTIDDAGNKKEKLEYTFPTGMYTRRDFFSKVLCNEKSVSFCSPFYLYNREFLVKSKLRFFEGILHEDELWMPIVLLKSENIVVTDVFFYYHYTRIGSIMHSSNYQRSAESTLKVCKLLDSEFDKYDLNDVKWLRNRVAILFLRAIPQLDSPQKAIKEFGRFFPVRNAASMKQKVKALVYCIAPNLYCLAVRRYRGYC